MKRIILCVLGCILLVMWAGTAQAEECQHSVLENAVIELTYEQEAGSHSLLFVRTGWCAACERTVARTNYGGFERHGFDLSESIHYEAESMHIWVFLDPKCGCVSLLKERCGGGEQCYTYKALSGETVPVQQGESWELHLLLTDEDYVKRWITQDRIE